MYVMGLGLGEFVDWGFRVVEESVRSQTGLEFDQMGEKARILFLEADKLLGNFG